MSILLRINDLTWEFSGTDDAFICTEIFVIWPKTCHRSPRRLRPQLTNRCILNAETWSIWKEISVKICREMLYWYFFELKAENMGLSCTIYKCW